MAPYQADDAAAASEPGEPLVRGPQVMREGLQPSRKIIVYQVRFWQKATVHSFHLNDRLWSTSAGRRWDKTAVRSDVSNGGFCQKPTFSVCTTGTA